MKDKFIILVLIIFSFTLAGCKLSGKIVDKGSIPLEGVTLKLSSENLDEEITTITNGKGEYEFEVEVNEVGEYTITPVLDLYVFYPDQISVTVDYFTPTTGIPNIDFCEENWINVSGTAYNMFGFALDKFNKAFFKGGDVSIIEFPEFITKIDDNGNFKFENLPSGQQATFVLKMPETDTDTPSYSVTATKTFILPKEDLKDVSFQVPHNIIYDTLAEELDVIQNKYSIITTVTTENPESVRVMGLKCVNVKAELVDDNDPYNSEGIEVDITNQGPIYFSRITWGDKSGPVPNMNLKHTAPDGGVLFYNLDAGTYRLTAEMDENCDIPDKYVFEPIIFKCSGDIKLFNAAPVHNLQGKLIDNH